MKKVYATAFALLLGALLPEGGGVSASPSREAQKAAQANEQAIEQAGNQAGENSAQQTPQRRHVTGTVNGVAGPITGASVMIEGTQTGTSTDAQGRFAIDMLQGQALTVSFMGYDNQRVVPGVRTNVSVTLQTSTVQLGQVVVTALGIEREKESLGYSMQAISGETVADRRETNITNALSGTIAGLQVLRSSNGPAGSSKIVLRGNSSLTGDNQPLIVVDGTPMGNSAGSDNHNLYNPNPDMGNGLSDLNAEDIESISVLKGGSAAALYGSRAGNGVILITTKTGRGSKGLGITISSTVQSTSPFMTPKMQNNYGQGENGIYDRNSKYSWGPRIEGQQVTDWRGETVNMRAYDNLNAFINNGTNLTENITFQQQLNRTSLYTSFGRTDDKSMIPGAKYARTNITTHAVTVFGKTDRWTLDTKAQYIRTKANNRPAGGMENSRNSFYWLYNLPRSLDISTLSNSVDEYGKMVWYSPDATSTNPYWNAKYDLNQDIRDRYLLSGALKYRFTDWLNGEIRAGLDSYTTNSENKKYAGSINNANGSYSVGTSTYRESNMSFLFTGGKDHLFWNKMGVNGTFGGNLMEQSATNLTSSVPDLVVPNLFSLWNGTTKADVAFQPLVGHKKVNSLYGSVQLNWDRWIFLDATLRNDWSSTLSKANRSFLYPSVSMSYVFTNMAESMNWSVPKWLSTARLRASYAEVGNDMGAYRLYNTYNVGSNQQGNTVASPKPVLYNENVKNENIKSAEVGGEFRFLNNRLGLDVSWYKSNATNQLIEIPRDGMSGYEREMVNAGNIQNRGWEFMVDARVLERPSGFTWDAMANLSFNRNTVKDLGAIGTKYSLGGYDQLQVLAIEGGDYGEIWGTKFARVTDRNSPYYGKLIVDANGLPTRTTESERLGTQQASALLGITNTFNYKGFGLSFLIDCRFGGKIFSGTNAKMQGYGTAAATANREERVLDGVVSDGGGGWVQNTKAITAQSYWQTVGDGGGNLGIHEFNTYDATNIRLRNVQLNYNFSKRMLAKTPFQKLSVGVACNNVWMLKSHLNGVDPESVYGIGTNATGFEMTSPATVRTLMFNVTLGF